MHELDELDEVTERADPPGAPTRCSFGVGREGQGAGWNNDQRRACVTGIVKPITTV